MEGSNQEQNIAQSATQQVSDVQVTQEQSSTQNAENQNVAVQEKQEEAGLIIEKASEKSEQPRQSNPQIQTKSQAHPQPQPQPQQSPQNQQNAKVAQPQGKSQGVNKDLLWYIDNYILLRDYYERTISRIAARCVRMGNIALEEYPHYSYILDVLQEINDTGNLIISHKELYPYVERKIKGGIEALRKNLKEYELELEKNSSPDMIKEDTSAVAKMKEALGEIDIKDDPTQGAGMGMDALMEKLMKQNQVDTSQYESYDQNVTTPEFNPGKPKQN